MWLTLMLGCPPAGESGKGVEPADTVNTVESAGDSGCMAGTEMCDGVDNDCDGVVDEEAADAQLVYGDGDGDGYGDDATWTMGCAAPGGYVAVGGDCEDSRQSIRARRSARTAWIRAAGRGGRRADGQGSGMWKMQTSRWRRSPFGAGFLRMGRGMWTGMGATRWCSAGGQRRPLGILSDRSILCMGMRWWETSQMRQSR